MLGASLGAPDSRLRPVAPVVAVRQHRSDTVLDCLAALPDIQRRTIVLTCYRHMSGREVADALSIDVRTVYSHLHDALTAIKSRHTRTVNSGMTRR